MSNSGQKGPFLIVKNSLKIGFIIGLLRSPPPPPCFLVVAADCRVSVFRGPTFPWITGRGCPGLVLQCWGRWVRARGASAQTFPGGTVLLLRASAWRGGGEEDEESAAGGGGGDVDVLAGTRGGGGGGGGDGEVGVRDACGRGGRSSGDGGGW